MVVTLSVYFENENQLLGQNTTKQWGNTSNTTNNNEHKLSFSFMYFYHHWICELRRQSEKRQKSTIDMFIYLDECNESF